MPGKRVQTHYVCSECGERSLKWFGRCPGCEGWNTLVEEVADSRKDRRRGAATATVPKPLLLGQAVANETDRLPLGDGEIDRVLGGGIVPGSLVLLGGEPGVGKSTLLLQLGSMYAGRHGSVLYVTGEESARQVALRAARLKLPVDNVSILSETSVDVITDVVRSVKPGLLIIDSIQTMVHPDLESSPGSVGQVRECCNVLGRLAKSQDLPVFLVGHVNKQGSLAGPKVLEHAVDVVLSFDGDRQTSFRMLRPIKNRYGSTHEIGLFEMKTAGLIPVANPSEFFLAERPKGSAGSVVTACREGSRPVLVEVQALVGPAAFGGTPRRQVAGVDYNRVSIILAVLEKRVGIKLQSHDVYINVAGGVRVFEPSCDLAIGIAIASSFYDKSLDPLTVVFGEVGLAGEIRSVTHATERVKEAARLGFHTAVIPAHRAQEAAAEAGRARVVDVESVAEALRHTLGR